MNDSKNIHTTSRSATESPAVSSENKQTVVFLAQFESLDHVRQFVAHKAEIAGMDDAAVYSVQLAVDEAFSNIIEHAYGGECLKDIRVTCEITGPSLEITLIDCGKPFDPDEVPNPDLTADLEDRQIGGLGLYFIHQLMDEVSFTFTSPDLGPCNVLKMVKRKEKVR